MLQILFVLLASFAHAESSQSWIDAHFEKCTEAFSRELGLEGLQSLRIAKAICRNEFVFWSTAVDDIEDEGRPELKRAFVSRLEDTRIEPIEIALRGISTQNLKQVQAAVGRVLFGWRTQFVNANTQEPSHLKPGSSWVVALDLEKWMEDGRKRLSSWKESLHDQESLHVILVRTTRSREALGESQDFEPYLFLNGFREIEPGLPCGQILSGKATPVTRAARLTKN